MMLDNVPMFFLLLGTIIVNTVISRLQFVLAGRTSNYR